MDYTIQEQIKILSKIKDNLGVRLRKGSPPYMCYILKGMFIECKFLEYSGLRDLWKSKGHTALDQYNFPWRLKYEKDGYKIFYGERAEIKKQCIDELIGIKQQLLSQEKQ